MDGEAGWWTTSGNIGLPPLEGSWEWVDNTTANTCDPALKFLNEEITSDIQKHKQNIWKEHLDTHWDHRHNTHTIWKIIHGLSNRVPPHTLNTSITFNNKIATTPKHNVNCFTKQFTNTQHTKQTDILTGQHTTYKDTISHSLLLRSNRL